MNKLIITLLFLLISATISAGEYLYWIQLNTKEGTPYTLSEPDKFLSARALERRARHSIEPDSSDFPVNPSFTDSLKSIGFRIKHTSRWMNGIIAYLPQETDIDTVFKPSFVDYYELRKGSLLKSTSAKFKQPDTLTRAYYGQAYRQIEMLNGHEVHAYSRGEGVHIAVIDAGFNNTNILPAFDSLYANNRILGTFDFVNPMGDVYLEHSHGTMVLSVLGANLPGNIVGTAPEASYWLLRSEDARSEWPVEEDYWIIAAEFADSVGCDVINTSLGYTTFDDPEFNHTYKLFDGKTLRISRAANLAVDKGLIVVCSAGNSGNTAWRYISAPAEAEKVLSVAAVNAVGNISSFSSRGFTEAETILKPDIAAMGQEVTVVSQSGNIVKSNGTSFSSPIISGMAACLADIFPNKQGSEIMQLIRQFGNIYPEHSADYGYGIPNFASLTDTISKYITQSASDKTSLYQLVSLRIYPNPFTTSFTIYNNLSASKLIIFNLNGKEVYTENITSRNQKIKSSKLTELPAGIYIASLQNEKQKQTLKLIKQ